MLTTIRSRVQSQVAAGKSLQDVKASRPAKEWGDTLDKGFINGDPITEFVHRILSKK